MKKYMLNKQNSEKIGVLFCTVVLLTGCSGSSETNETNESDSTVHKMSFKTLSAEESGITFLNKITETDSFNYFSYEYMYNGGGVAVGDINNDGLTDIYFTGNQVSDKLYLNKGDLKFEDITESALGSEATEGWRTGVVMVDINNDGWLDMYVSRSGKPSDKALLSNQLYVNNKDLTFTESSLEYGIDSKRPTTQSAFFDYDKDGDLDLYIMNHPYNTSRTREDKKSVQEVEAMTKRGTEFSDQLYRNENGKFSDVSKEAGISNYAFGLGLAIGDVNGDGFEDIYVSNDYMAPDYLYMNNGDGTFSEEIKQRTGHISNYSMGNDMADFNNDGFLDVITVDMVSEDHIRSKKNMGGMSTKKFWDVVNSGYHYQYMFNALQLNNGDGTFSEIAQVAGISKTDWSWAPLFADFDNDGFNDLFITNGYRRDTRDNDFNMEAQKRNGQFSGFEEALDLMPATKIENYFYQNAGDLHFKKVTEEWGANQPVNSNGAAYADLDNDGDLDLILNNMDEVSFILENQLKSGNNYIKIKVEGSPGNLDAVGATIKIKTTAGIQFKSVQRERGYLSSVDPIIHFGLGSADKIEEIVVVFADNKSVILNDVAANQVLIVSYGSAKNQIMNPEKPNPIFELVKNPSLQFEHKELFVDDFEKEILLPNKMSQLGPFASTGDVNGDGLEDIYVSGSRGFSGSMYIQNSEGKFDLMTGPWAAEKMREEAGSAIFDIENDGDNDLLVVSGSNEYEYNSAMMKTQLYMNEGNGKFINDSRQRLPDMEISGQCVTTGDYDKDGDMDVFLGGRQTPGYYPFAPRSYLLKNNGGIFEEVTLASPDLMGPGLITESLFDDIDADGDLDLICVGEWMPVTFFENNLGVFTNVTQKYNLQNTVGWWTSISAGDFNGDGKNDYVVGNVGENNKFHPSADHPLEIYCHDFDGNGTYDIVLGKYQNGICYPVRGRQCSSEQMPFIKEKFPTYNEFAIANLESIYGKENLEKALHFTATEFHSSVILSDGNNFKIQHLPVLAQLGPLNKTLVGDYNEDGYLDVLGAGNNYGAEVETIRYDGGRGVLLFGKGDGSFTALTPTESGILINSDCKDLVSVGKSIFSFSNNGKTEQLIKK